MDGKTVYLSTNTGVGEGGGGVRRCIWGHTCLPVFIIWLAENRNITYICVNKFDGSCHFHQQYQMVEILWPLGIPL